MEYVNAFWVGGLILCTGADIAGQNEAAARAGHGIAGVSGSNHQFLWLV